MSIFVAAGREAAFQYCIEGEEEKVVASLYISKDNPCIKEFPDRHAASNWIQSEVKRLMGADYYGR